MWKKKPETPAPALLPADLDELDLKIIDAEKRRTEAQKRVARLEVIIYEETEAKAALDTQIGKEKPRGTAKLLARAQAAMTAADSARNQMPEAEAAVRASDADIRGLQDKRRRTVLAHVLVQADVLARQYTTAFAELCRAHDHLVGVSKALQAHGFHRSLRLVDELVQAPSFDIEALHEPGLPVSTHLKHQPSASDINATSEEWSGLISSLGVARSSINCMDDGSIAIMPIRTRPEEEFYRTGALPEGVSIETLPDGHPAKTIPHDRTRTVIDLAKEMAKEKTGLE